MGRYILEHYDSKGRKCLPTIEVDQPMQALTELGKRSTLDYAFATCYLIQSNGRADVQWELEVKEHHEIGI